MIQVDIEHFENHRRDFYSACWEQLPFYWSAVDKNKKPKFSGSHNVKQPELLDEMVLLAEKLSHDFGYIRVDLYHCHCTIYFGEHTLNHGSGFELFFPDEYDFTIVQNLMLAPDNMLSFFLPCLAKTAFAFGTKKSLRI